MRVQNYQGLVLAKGSHTGEAPLLQFFHRKLLDSIEYNRLYHKTLKIHHVVVRRSPSHDNKPIMVPQRDDNDKWKMILQILYLRRLQNNEKNDLASLQEWSELVKQGISKSNSPLRPMKRKITFASDITDITVTNKDCDGADILPTLDTIFLPRDLGNRGELYIVGNLFGFRTKGHQCLIGARGTSPTGPPLFLDHFNKELEESLKQKKGATETDQRLHKVLNIMNIAHRKNYPRNEKVNLIYKDIDRVEVD